MSDDIARDIRELTAAVSRLHPAARAGYSSSNVELEAAVKSALKNTRSPSLALQIGSGIRADSPAAAFMDSPLKATLGRDYVPGSLITAVMEARSRDADDQARGKAALDELGLAWREAPEGKATIGTTGATGGYVLPNNLVDQVIKPEVAEAVYANLVTERTGVNVRGVDLPFRTGAPARATFQDWGATKENVNETYGSYTANLGTLARIYDVGKQYLRFSAGSAEQDVMDELAKAMRLGENFSILAGAGTGSVGSGDPTTGVYTATAAASAFNGYSTAFAAASQSTVAGSAAAGLAAGMKALASRNVRATAVVTDAITYWTMIVQGSDTAGFWVSPDTGPTGFTQTQSGQLQFWGVPIFWDPQFNTNTATTKAAILADWRVFRLYRGMEFRIDSSDQAGTRWDQNLIGFRGEEEIGFDARPGVYTGHAQIVTALIA